MLWEELLEEVILCIFFFIANTFKGQVHAFAGQIKNCTSLVLQDKFNIEIFLFCLFVCFVALRTKSTAMVIAGRSVHLTTLFPGQA